MTRLLRTIGLGLRVLLAKAGRARPLYVHYGVTHRCNMRCRMCAVWQDGDEASELPVPAIRQMARELVRAGVRMVALGGGEPFVRRDLPEIVAAFAGQGADVRLLTNGISLSNAQIEAVARAGVRHVSISLDTADPAKEKHIYGGQDVWDQIIESMRRFRRVLATPPAIPIMNVCVSRLNMNELPGLVDLAAAEGFFCSFIPITLSAGAEQPDGFAAVAPELGIRPEDHAPVTAAYTELLRMKQSGAPIANSSRFLADSLEFLKTGACAWKCDAGRLYFSVSPRGAISVCHRFAPVAQFDAPGLARHLNSPQVRQAAAEQAARCPGCMRPCWAEVTHLVHGWQSGWESIKLGAHLRPPARQASARRGREENSR